MKKSLVFLAVILIGFASVSLGQTRSIDLKGIERIAKTEAYTALLDRYLENDTTLGIEEYRIIYYGHAFQSNYRPNGRHDSIGALHDYMSKGMDNVDFEKVLSYTLAILKEYPFNIDHVLYTGIAYDMLGDKANALLYLHKYTSLIKTILSSGDGLKQESAFVVTKITDEYSVLSALELDFKQQSLVSKKNKYYDLMEVKKNPNKVKELYFDINLFFGKMD